MTAEAGLRELLATGPLEVEARLAGASNATLRCRVEGTDVACVYKPVRGERPLWDFPEGTLSHREVAAYELAELAGWPFVPLTVWRDDGPFGPGMCQLWIHADPAQVVVDVVPIAHERPGWLSIVEGEDGEGQQVRLIHAHAEDLQHVALLDAVMNNADRKGGHLLVDGDERLWAIDHGVCFGVDPKLRTVLWGWGGQPVPAEALAGLAALADRLQSADGEPVARWLGADEFDALLQRTHDVISAGTFPLPAPHWPPLPWPLF